MKLIALILSLILVLNSCSSLKTNTDFERYPANSPVSFEEVMSIKKSGKKGKDYKKEFTSFATQALAPNNTMTSELKLATDLPKDVAFKLELDVVDGKYVYRILHSADAFTDHLAMVEMANFATNVAQGTRFLTHFSDFEMYYNARENDLESLNNFLKLRMQENYDPLSVKYDGGDFSSLLKERIIETKEMADQLSPLLKAQNKARKVAEEKRKAVLDTLDKVAKEEQFKALIAKNDRKGVADLLKKYLPYEDMAPFERRFWDNALDIIGYHRTVCAEMAAIMDSARRGVSIRDGTVYSTTFPCHICMKHIISAGISKVVYIEPYPKSKTSDMFNDFVNESVSCVCNDKVNVIPYIGVAPNRYLYVYSPDYRDRKEYTKERKDFKPTVPKHLKHKYSFCYQEQENSIIAHLEELLAGDAETDKSWWSRNLSDKPLEKV